MNLIPDKPEHCPSCGKKFEGPFCYECGEKQTSPKDYSLKKYSEHALDMFTHFDGKFFRSIKYLLFFPGKLTEDNLLGRKVKLMKPVQLFVVVSLVYFFLMKHTDILYSPLRNLDYTEVYPAAQRIAQERGVTFEAYEQQYDYVSIATAKTLTFTYIPFFAIMLWLLYSRRSKFLVPHLIYATHFFAFFLAFVLLYFELILRWLNPEELTSTQKLIGLSAGLLVIGVYMFFSLKRVYKQSNFISVVKTSALMVWLLAVLTGYRVGISWLTLWLA